MEKILFLDTDVDDFGLFFREKRNLIKNVDSYSLYKEVPILLKKIFIILGLYLAPIFLYLIYGNWKKKLDEYSLIIVPSRKASKYLLKRKYRNKVVVYYWNLITSEELQPDYLKKKNIKCCTFDKGDAEKYGIDFVDTYHFDLKCNENEITTDVFYVGVERDDRVKVISELSNYFLDNDIIFDNNLIKKNSLKGRLSYQEVLNRISKSKCILDLNRNNQKGLTLRPLESIIFSKKLITNNTDVINFNFYSKENVFILGKDNIDDLKLFISSNYKNIDKELVEYYYFENWVNRLYDKYK